jgi:hypothetical protein
MIDRMPAEPTCTGLTIDGPSACEAQQNLVIPISVGDGGRGLEEREAARKSAPHRPAPKPTHCGLIDGAVTERSPADQNHSGGVYESEYQRADGRVVSVRCPWGGCDPDVTCPK